MTRPHIRFTALLWDVLQALDAGHSESFDTVSRWIDERSVAQNFQKYGFHPLSGSWNEDTETKFYRVLDDLREDDARRKFGVEKNGLVWLAAMATEAIQRVVTDSEELQLD